MAERLRDVPGLGEKVERNILDALETPPEEGNDRRCSRTFSRSRSRSWKSCAPIPQPSASSSPEACAAGPRPARTSTSSRARTDRSALGEALAGLDVVLEAGSVGDAGTRIVTHNGSRSS